MAAGSCVGFSPNFIFSQRGGEPEVNSQGIPQSRLRARKFSCCRVTSSLHSCGLVEKNSKTLRKQEENGFFRPNLGWPMVPGSSPKLQVLGDLFGDTREDDHKLMIEDKMLSCGVKVESATPPPPKQKQEKGKDYHINVGYAIRSLREELPGMFYKEPTFDIYREDITFRDPLITFSGISNYKLMFWGLRFYSRIFFKAIWIEIHRIWQPRDKVIMVRWTVYGVPRVPWEVRGQFDATSEYKLDSEGLIYEHKVDNLILNDPPKFKTPAVIDLVAAAGVGQTATPSYYYIRCFLLGLQRFTWVRYYLALRSTLVLC